jgi:succinyl-diaminopimelate desuccinylase
MHPIVDRWIDEHKGDIVAAVQKSVSFRSVGVDSDEPGAPFGIPCRDMLLHTLALCGSFGFDTKNLDGYIGFADFGEGEETLGILSHLDIVPEGEGWQHDPFGGEIVDGQIVGRGTQDDKGPAMAAIYALAAVKEAGFRFRRKVRLIFGCDEERSMRCLKYYKAHAQMPDLAFSPDAMYPLVNSEKNIFHARYTAAFPSALRLQAGTVVNAVPGKAAATAPFPKETVLAAAAQCPSDGFSYEAEACEGGSRITVTGKAAHASTPEAGKNALQAMLLLLDKLPLTGMDKRVVAGLVRAFGMECHGETVGLDISDDSGRLTLNPGLMDYNEQGFSITLDIRAPISAGCDLLLEKLDAAFAGFGASRAEYMFSEGYYVPEDNELVRTLLDVYAARTGERTPPHRIGGGTYARHLKMAVAFGPERPNRENLVHMANESLYIEDLIEDTKMYADAIIALATK